MCRQDSHERENRHYTAIADLREGRTPSLASISSQTDVDAFNASRKSAPLSTAARSEVAVEYLAQTYGQAALGRLLRENVGGSPSTFNQHLTEVTGVSVDGLDAAVSRWLLK
ncbi:MAG: hypothetical protein ACR2PL_03145 [Dehalococcoidia bacterium]